MLVLALAAMIGGAMNSVAGGGSFLSFPALIFSGVPPIQANATSTVALWPGTAAAVGAYRAELRAARHVVPLSIASAVGGVLGAVLLLKTPQATFAGLIPFLLLLATMLFAASGAITRRLRSSKVQRETSAVQTVVLMSAGQLVIATYGGYFGGGIGILMLATLALMGMDNIHEMNALKTLLASFINGVAVLTFLVAGKVVWPQAGFMVVGAIAGGYLGAAFARKLDPRVVRRVIIAVGVVLTVYFFYRSFVGQGA